MQFGFCTRNQKYTYVWYNLFMDNQCLRISYNTLNSTLSRQVHLAQATEHSINFLSSNLNYRKHENLEYFVGANYKTTNVM